MKAWTVALALVAATAQASAADEPPPPDPKQLDRDFIALSYWSFLPDLLLKRCEREYADELVQVRLGATEWFTTQMERHQQVERARALLRKVLSDATHKPPEKIDADFKQAIDQRVVQGMFNDFSRDDTHQLCTHLEKTFPRVTAAAEGGLDPALQRVDALVKQVLDHKAPE